MGQTIRKLIRTCPSRLCYPTQPKWGAHSIIFLTFGPYKPTYEHNLKHLKLLRRYVSPLTFYYNTQNIKEISNKDRF